MTTHFSPSDLTLPLVDDSALDIPTQDKLSLHGGATHPPRILLLYGSLRERSYSRLLTEEAARILNRLGAETRIFDSHGLPLPDSVPADHPKVAEHRELSNRSEERRVGTEGVGTCRFRCSQEQKKKKTKYKNT